jgi:hypothetical protein
MSLLQGRVGRLLFGRWFATAPAAK